MEGDCGTESLPGESITGTHDGLLRLFLKRDSGSLHRVHRNGPSFRILHLLQPSLSTKGPSLSLLANLHQKIGASPVAQR